MFPENGPTYQVTEAVRWTCEPSGQADALVAVEFSLRSAPEPMIAKALYELRTVTRGRVNRDQDDDTAEALIFTERLRQFPGDIVLDVLRSWPSRPDGQWWPTWHDLLKVIEPAATARKMLADHVRSGACLPKPAEQPVKRDLTEDEIAARREFAQKIRERHPLNPAAVPAKKMTDAEWAEREAEERARCAGIKLSPAAAALVRDQIEAARRGADEYERRNGSPLSMQKDEAA